MIALETRNFKKTQYRMDIESFSCIGDEPKSGLARDLGDCLQSRNVPFGTSGDSVNQERTEAKSRIRKSGVCGSAVRIALQIDS